MSSLARIEHAERGTAFQYAALFSLLCGVLLFDACSGIQPTTSNTSSANNSASSIAISAALPAATLGAAYDATLSVSGGTAPYIFSLASGQLPPSVALDPPTGTISGTPSAAGNFNFAVSVADSRGLSKQQSLQISVSSAPAAGSSNSFSNIQNSSGWAGYGQGPPNFVDCSPSPCEGVTYSMTQGIQSPSMSGKTAQYSLGGSAVYSDALFNNHLIGDLSSQGVPDSNHTLAANYHNFTYDVYFYGTNLELSQALEFDVNQFVNNLGFIWGHQCRIAGGNEWDVWDNLNQLWIPTGVPCHPNDNSWNHLTIQVQRTADNQLLYQSITLNGVTGTVNQFYDHGSAPGWNGVTVNFQMDGNYQQSPYSVYLDQLTFSYQ